MFFHTGLRSTQTAPTGDNSNPIHWGPVHVLKQLEQAVLSPVIDALANKFAVFSESMLREQEYAYDKDIYNALNVEVKHLKDKAEEIVFWREFEVDWKRRYAEQQQQQQQGKK